MNTLDSLVSGLSRSRAEALRDLKGWVQEERAALIARHPPSRDGRELFRLLAGWMDRLVLRLLDHARARSASAAAANGAPQEGPPPDGPAVPDFALLAVGGYGRGEMHLFSDVDLLFLTPGPITAEVEETARTLFHLLWDLGFEVGHGCWSLAQAQAAMGEDVETTSSFFEARLLHGDLELYEAFRKSLKERLSNGTLFLRGLLRHVADRRREAGGSVYRMEPHLKEAVGGLRDFQAVKVLERLIPWVDEGGGRRSPFRERRGDFLRAEKAYLFLMNVRAALHLAAGRRTDVLETRLQRPVAQALGYAASEEGLAEELFMKAWFEAAAEVFHFLRLAAAFCEGHILPGPGFRDYKARRPVDADLVAIGGKLYASGAQFLARPIPGRRVMEIFHIAQTRRLALSDELLLALRAQAPLLGDGFRTDPQVAVSFRSILRAVRNAGATLRMMHDAGVLGEYLPEFGELKALVRFSLYHDYTVDEHTLLAIEELDALADAPDLEGRAKAELLHALERPDLLRLGLLLHDIGKTRRHEHSEVGAERVPLIARRLRLTDEEARLLRFLVRDHLRMAEISHQRNFSEEGIVADLAARVKTSERLKMLYLMTYADIRAVGRGSFAKWQDAILQELFHRTLAHLHPGRPAAAGPSADAYDRELLSALPLFIDRAEARRHLERVPARYRIEVEPDQAVFHLTLIQGLRLSKVVTAWTVRESFNDFAVCAYDRPFLFADICGTLLAHGFNVISAQAYTRKDGVIVDDFRVADAGGRVVADPKVWQRVDASLKEVLLGRRSLEELLRRREERFRPERRVLPETPIVVAVNNKISPDYTIVDVSAPDRVGLLFAISHTLSTLGFDIHFARISTWGPAAVNSFYVTGQGGAKVEDPSFLEKAHEELVKACG